MPAETSWPQPYNPLLLRFFRLLDAFAKSDDERDFYLDRCEGFLVYADLNKGQTELDALAQDLATHAERYVLLPKLTFFEAKKIMEGFVNEKVYDIDAKEKLLDIIQSRDPRENFLEFIYDHHSEIEKWQTYFVERFRIRIIEWLRAQNFNFVFEEDLDLPRPVIEKIKRSCFIAKVPKDVVAAREALVVKAKTYYSNEALNPRPKRGRPPKQVVKIEVEPTVTPDMYTQVTVTVRPFLFLPDINNASAVTFSGRFETEEAFLAHLRGGQRTEQQSRLQILTERLASLQALSHRLAKTEQPQANLQRTLTGIDPEERKMHLGLMRPEEQK
ncbi:MAG: UPF0158 family protein [Chlamydiia bacterium]